MDRGREDNGLSYRRRGQKELEEALKKRAEEERRLAEDVMACKPFRDWLTALATKYGYLSTPMERKPYDQGANDAVRNLINNLVKTTSEGPRWLSEYASSYLKKETK